jgi:hypothetical protein
VKTFTPGDWVRANDGRTGYVKGVDYGGVHVSLVATNDAGAELRVYLPEQLTPTAEPDLFDQ